MTPRPAPQPWDQLADEPASAYRAASTYFRLGCNRSLDLTQRTLVRTLVSGGHEGDARGTDGAPHRRNRTGRIQAWSKRFRWVERAAAWDQHLHEAEQKAADLAAIEQVQARARRWAERTNTLTETCWLVFMVVARRLQRIAKLEETDKPASGERVGEILRQLEVAVRLAEKSLAMLAPPADPGRDQTPQPTIPLPPDLARKWHEFTAAEALRQQGFANAQPDDFDYDRRVQRPSYKEIHR